MLILAVLGYSRVKLTVNLTVNLGPGIESWIRSAFTEGEPRDRDLSQRSSTDNGLVALPFLLKYPNLNARDSASAVPPDIRKKLLGGGLLRFLNLAVKKAARQTSHIGWPASGIDSDVRS